MPSKHFAGSAPPDAPSAKRPREHADGSAGKAVGDQRRKACTHVVAVPVTFDASSIQLDEGVYGTLESPSFDSKNYVKKYSFKLDQFQAISVACVERNESVMVAAHTSAGKTAIAEYAVAKALHQKQRVIYTSPLKALSNQKYRELEGEFEDVGLMTGDVAINTDASCVVMTTEILRSMLYRGSEMMREIAWVVFDEIHYMQDRERGVVWEETIISLPRAVRMVFLSATLSNAHEFAEWVAHLHAQPCHVVTTDYRPTPLEHFILPCITSKQGPGPKTGGLYKVCTKDGEFLTRMWKELKAAGTIQGESLEGTEAGAGGEPPVDLVGRKELNKPKRDMTNLSNRVADLLRLAKDKKLYPVIVFSFVRRECETFAMTCWNESNKSGSDDLDFTTDEEKTQIELIYDNAVGSLNEDADLPAVRNVKRYLMKGYGVHHGGLIPTVKELVEILFQEGYLKVLFATETFAMGLNLPARAVVFTAFSKHDGEGHRLLTSGEYIQMSGRAGRRGKDDRGYCILLVEDPDVYSPAMARGMMQGLAMPLMSRFKLSYYTLLNLTKRMEGGMDQMEYLISNSFQQFQHDQALPKWRARLQQLEQQLSSMENAGLTTEACDQYVELRDEIGRQQKVVHDAMCSPQVLLQFLNAGRLVRVRQGAVDWGWGIVIQTHQQNRPQDSNAQEAGTHPSSSAADEQGLQVVIMLCVKAASITAGAPEPEGLDSPAAELLAMPVPLRLVVAIGRDRMALPPDLRTPHARRDLLGSLRKLVLEYSGDADGVDALDPVADLGLNGPEVVAALTKVAQLKEQLKGNVIHEKGQAGGEGERAQFLAFKELALEREKLLGKIAKSELSEFHDQVAKRRRVLRKLGHLTGDGMLTAKGQAAAEVDTADELMTAELMFNAVWKTLDTPQLVAILSCLVPCNEQHSDDREGVKLPLELGSAMQMLQEFAGHICDVTNECGLELEKDDYITSFTPNLMLSLFQWASGASFREVTDATMIYEGTLVRCSRRLMELMGQIISAAEKIGEHEMQEQMDKALKSLQRGIMYCSSLYL